MPQTPGESPGPEARGPGTVGDIAIEPAYRRPTRALVVAALGFALTVVLILIYPDVRAAMLTWPQWALRVTDLIVFSAPLVAAVVVAGSAAADGWARATGIRNWRWTDALVGVLVGLVLRSVVELVEPTAGSLFGPFEDEVTPDTVSGAIALALGLLVVSPVVEELYFRGLVLRAMDDALRGAGKVLGPLVALVVSTAAFAALHILPGGANVQVALLVSSIGVGLGCGILTLLTHRLGPAIVTHVTFNAIGVALLLT